MAKRVRARRAISAVASKSHPTIANRRSGKVGVFISYSTENESLAKKLKEELLDLDAGKRLEVFIAAELGGRAWRQAIRETLHTAQILLLPYPNKTMKLDWVCYELGMFHSNEVGRAVCIMNTQLDSPPDQMSEWQAYRADKKDLRKFFVDLFQKGAFTDGVPINPDVDADERARERLDEAVQQIEAEFAAFRLHERYYTHRIEIQMPPAKNRLPAKLDFEHAVVCGNEQTLAIFGVDIGARWKILKQRCSTVHTGVQWIAQIEALARTSKDKQLAGTLAPFRTEQQRTFIPLVSRIETIEEELSQVNVVFVELNSEVRLPLERHAGFDRMPSAWTAPFSLLEIGRRFRFGPLDAALTAMSFPKGDAPSKWEEDAKALLQAIAEASADVRGINIHGAESFFNVFDLDLRKPLKDAVSGWSGAESDLRLATRQSSRKRALQAVERMGRINAVFLDCTVQQAARLVARLKDEPAKPMPTEQARSAKFKAVPKVAAIKDMANVLPLKDSAGGPGTKGATRPAT
ncbi:MAG TPA: hypothetical protein VNH16_24395 [Burkholderiales bacterium]|jgi:hypothetical protein|nr:hypothetical protein [Burkholderiales bacterium]